MLFQSGIVEIKNAFRFIGVSVAFAIFDEEADRPIKRVDHDLGGFALLGRLECGIESPHEIPFVAHAIGAQHEIESRSADKIKPWDIVTRSQDSADGNLFVHLLAESIQQNI